MGPSSLFLSLLLLLLRLLLVLLVWCCLCNYCCCRCCCRCFCCCCCSYWCCWCWYCCHYRCCCCRCSCCKVRPQALGEGVIWNVDVSLARFALRALVSLSWEQFRLQCTCLFVAVVCEFASNSSKE